jgi:GNAT superfamily N-acetyltransferase
MQTARIAYEPFLDEATRQAIVDGVDNHNISVTQLPDWWDVNFVLRGGGNVLGGILGYVWGGWLQVTHLWVAEPARGAGYGTQLMLRAEAYARSRGAVGVTLETYSFQVEPFYRRLGYEVFGSLPGCPVRHTKFFLRKSLL